MKEIRMKKVIFVFLVLFMYIFLTAGEEEYEYIPFQVKISEVLKTFYSDKIRPGTGKEEWEYALDEIDKSLRGSFNAVWKTFESQKGKIKDTIIRDAIEKLRIKIRNKEKFIGIEFGLKYAYGKYYEDNYLVKVGGMVVDSKLTNETIIKNKDVNAEVVKNDSDVATIGIFNGFENFQVLNMEYFYKAKGCKYEGYKDYSETFEKPLKDILPTGWKWTPSKTYSFQSALFHELVHIALEDAGHERWGDEATVEDITLLIFPRNPVNKGEGVAHGANFREMTYDKALVDGDFQRTNIYDIPGLFTFPLIDLIGNHYYNRKDRKFNPREKFNGIDLKYEESDIIGVIKYLGRDKGGNITCNDAVSLSLLRHSSLSPFFPFSLLLTKVSICA
jgi:hypothetical protein